MSENDLNIKLRSPSLPNLQIKNNYQNSYSSKRAYEEKYSTNHTKAQTIKQPSNQNMPNIQRNSLKFIQPQLKTSFYQKFLQQVKQKQLLSTRYKQNLIDSNQYSNRLISNINSQKRISLPLLNSNNNYAAIYLEERQKAIENIKKEVLSRKQQIQREVQAQFLSRKKSIDVLSMDRKKSVQDELKMYLRQSLQKQINQKRSQSQRNLKPTEYIDAKNKTKHYQTPQLQQKIKNLIITQRKTTTSAQQNFIIHPKIKEVQYQSQNQVKRQKYNNQQQKYTTQNQEIFSNRKRPKPKPVINEQFQELQSDLPIRKYKVYPQKDQIHQKRFPERQGLVKSPQKVQIKSKKKYSMQKQKQQFQDKLQERRLQLMRQRISQKQINIQLQRQISQSLQDKYSDLVIQNQKYRKQQQQIRRQQYQRRKLLKKRIQQKIEHQIDNKEWKNNYENRVINDKAVYPKKKKIDQQKYLQQKMSKKANKLFQKQLQKKLSTIKDYKISQQSAAESNNEIVKNDINYKNKPLYQKFRFKVEKDNKKRYTVSTSNNKQLQKENQKQDKMKIKFRSYKQKKQKGQRSYFQIDHIKMNSNIQIVQIKGQQNLQKYFDHHYQIIPDLIKKLNYCHSNINWLVYTLVKQVRNFTIFQYKKKNIKEIGIVVALCRDDEYMEQRNKQTPQEIYKDTIKKRRMHLIHIGSYKQSNTLQLIVQCAKFLFNKDPCEQIYFSFVYNSQNQQQKEFLQLFDDGFNKIGHIQQNKRKNIKLERKYVIKRQRFYEYVNKQEVKQMEQEKFKLEEKRPNKLQSNLGELFCSIDMLVSQEPLGYEENLEPTSDHFLIPGLFRLFLSQFMSTNKIQQLQQLQLQQELQHLPYLKNTTYNLLNLKQNFKQLIKNFTYLRTKRFETPKKLIQQLKKQNKNLLKCQKSLQQVRINCYRYSFLQQIGMLYKFKVQNLVFKYDAVNSYSCKYFRFMVQDNKQNNKENNNQSGFLSTSLVKKDYIECIRSNKFKNIDFYLLPSSKPQYKIFLMNLQDFDNMFIKNSNINQFLFDVIKYPHQRTKQDFKAIWMPQIDTINQKQQQSENINDSNSQDDYSNQIFQQQQQNSVQQKQKQPIKIKTKRQQFQCQQIKIIPNFKAKIDTKFSYFYKTYIENSLIYQPQLQHFGKNIIKNSSKSQSHSVKNYQTQKTKKSSNKNLQSQKRQLFIKPPFLIGVMDMNMQQQFGQGLLFAKRIDYEDLFQFQINPTQIKQSNSC